MNLFPNKTSNGFNCTTAGEGPAFCLAKGSCDQFKDKLSDITLTIDIIDKTSVINYCTSKKSRTNNLLSLKQSTNNKLKWCENLLIVTGSNNQLMKS